MLIRTAIRADVPAIAVLLADDGLGRGRERPEESALYNAAFDRMMAQPGNVYLVAEDPDCGFLVGCLQYTVLHGLSRAGASRAQIEGVRVAASHRGTGVGGLLIDAAIARAREDGCALVQLTTDRQRTDALRFYERHSFVASHWGCKLIL